MHTVKNVGDTTRRFNARRPDGNLFIARLAPGESGEFDADVNQAVFARDHLKATEIGDAKPKAAPKAAAARKHGAAKAVPTAKPTPAAADPEV